VNECKPLNVGPDRTLWYPFGEAPAYLDGTMPGDAGFDPFGRVLHSSTCQLNLSRVCHKNTPYTLPTPPDTP
jgi:hypothetical protein